MGNEHWVETTLREVVTNKKGKKPLVLSEKPFKNSLSYIDIEAFETGKIKQYADIESSTHCVNSDILVVWDGARFGLAGYNQKGAIGSTLACLTPIEIEPLYLLKFIQRNYQIIQQKPKGMATPHVDPEVFWNLEFPLAPLNEQKRIVEKLDAILPKVKQAKARLENISTILKKFRQSVLAAACSGKLTERWREGKDLPEWEEENIGNVITALNYGTSKKCDYSVKNGIPVLRIPNVSSGKLTLDDLKFAAFDKKEQSHYSLESGDLLMIRSNGSVSLLGLSVIVDDSVVGYAYAGYLICLKCNKQLMVPNFLHLVLSSNGLRTQIELPARSTTGVHNINSEEIKSLVVPLPPFPEQQEIVHQVEKLFAVADALEGKYQSAMSRVNKIEQAVLAKAFRGELAEADPDDEPAEELLKRILREKDND
ncbi:hypothetical protein AGMMS4952_20610 [Spirochaetia bacterium]|nr:hypothetical protein AGMMS4952_20580 [Spirochaetia bacterium]GHV31603.1 hypothetical protein AGMMS4952_20610 [Spirochaetia bacterium]